DASDYLDEFIKRAAVASYLKKDPSFKPAGTIVLDSVVKSGNWNDADKDGILDEGELDTTEKGLSFADATLALFDIFEVTFHVSEDPTATITVSMLITNGTPPTLVVPEHRHYERGEFTDANYMDGVYAYDNEDDDSQLVISVLNKIVDPNVEDVYVIYYTVEDTDGNITPGSGAISIGGVVDEDYWINAKDFTKKLVADNVQGTAEEAIRWSEAIGKYVGTNTETLKKGDVVPVIVADLGGYKKAAGVYNIKYAVEAHQAAAITKKATITDDSEPIIEEPIPLAAPPTLVVPDVRQYDLGAFTDANYMDGVTASDAVDGDLTAKVTYDKPVKPNKADAYVVTYSVTNSANLSATKTGVILIGDWVVKGGYGLYAQDFKAKLSKIEGTKAEAIELAKAKAIDLRRQVEEGSDDGTKLLAVGALAMVDNDRYGKELKVTVDDAGGYKKAAGKYKITFKIYGLTSKDAPAKKVTATITDDSKKPATTTTSGGGGGGGTAKTGDDMMLELLILLLILSAAAMVCIYLRKRQGDAQEA
ncbi:MAG: DUF5011 domain-containing protein, partial [Clostridiales Family XIII bacterium]|nr:DUF5011 domain-containing protein [Clostridiales Family XIII bacterium]